MAVMYAGSLVELGSRHDLFHAPAHPYTRGLLQAVPTLQTDRDRPLETIEGTVPRPRRLPWDALLSHVAVSGFRTAGEHCRRWRRLRRNTGHAVRWSITNEAHRAGRQRVFQSFRKTKQPNSVCACLARKGL